MKTNYIVQLFMLIVLISVLGLVGSVSAEPTTPTIPSTPTTTRTVCASGCNFTTIQAAINTAADFDIIHVQDFIHIEHSIRVNKHVTIMGNSINSTFVQAAATPGAATNRVFEIDLNTFVTIQDMTIRYGKSTFGGGIHSNGHLHLLHIRLQKNEAHYGGGYKY